MDGLIESIVGLINGANTHYVQRSGKDGMMIRGE